MSAVTSTNALAKDSTLQDVADAISTMGATSVGNLSALTTTDKTSLVGAVNEVKSGLTSLDFGKMVYDGATVNINTIITNGWHYGTSTGAGLDTVDDYYMLVMRTGNYIKQFIIGKFGYGKKLYMRYSSDGGSTWSVSKIEFTDVT